MSVLSDSVHPGTVKKFSILSTCEEHSHFTKIALWDGRKIYTILSDSDINTIIKSVAAERVQSFETFDHYASHRQTRSFSEIINSLFPVKPGLENGLLTSPSHSTLTLSEEEADYLVSNGHLEIFEMTQTIIEKQNKLSNYLRLSFVDVDIWNQFNRECQALQNLYRSINQLYSTYCIIEDRETQIKDKILMFCDARALTHLRTTFIKSLPLFEKRSPESYSNVLNCLLNNPVRSIKVSDETLVTLVNEVDQLMNRYTESLTTTTSVAKPKIDFSEKFNAFINAVVSSRPTVKEGEEPPPPIKKGEELPFNRLVYKRFDLYMPHWNLPNFPKAMRLFLNSGITVDELSRFINDQKFEADSNDSIRSLLYAVYYEWKNLKSESVSWYLQLATTYLDNGKYPEIVEEIIRHVRAIDPEPKKSAYSLLGDQLIHLKKSKTPKDKIDEELIECPIDYCLMEDAVIDPEGNSYGRIAIEKWLQTHNSSPLTNNPLTIKDLKPNFYIRNLVSKVIQNQMAEPAFKA